MSQRSQLVESSQESTEVDIEAMRRKLSTPDRLKALFAPKSVALVGASDGSGWSRFIVDSLRTAGISDKLVPVHPKHPEAFGMPTVPNLRDLAEPVDLAFALVPTHAVEGVMEDAVAAGIKNMIVLAADYAEGGEEGKARQQSLVNYATANDLTLLGPNCLGYINAHAGAAPFGLPILPPLRPGPVGVVLQSGALASNVMSFARARGVGISLLTSMGNEAIITAADVVEYLIEDDNTKVIAMFLEGIRDPARFTELADRALAAGKPIVALKAGRSPGGQATALAHTGAVAGDVAVVDAVFRQFGVVRVDSLEELIVTAGLFGYCDRPTGNRMGVVTASGGACDIIADRAHIEKIDIPDFASTTIDKLTAVLPPFASARNPLDVTGAILADVNSAQSGLGDVSLNAVAADPNIDFLINALALPAAEPPDAGPLERRLSAIAATAEQFDVPILHFVTTCNDISPYALQMLDKYSIHPPLGGIEFGLKSIGHALRWEQTRAKREEAGEPTRPQLVTKDVDAPQIGSWSEDQSRNFVTAHGVPVVPARLVTSAKDAVAAADELGYPVVLKVCSATITHKSDIGGVALNLGDAAAVEEAFERVHKAGLAESDDIDGVLVGAMRAGGVELFVGLTVDPSFGPVLALGLGGVFVEVLKDVSLRPLPVSQAQIAEMLDELRGAPLLHGARGSNPVDIDTLTAAIAGIVDSAQALGPTLGTLEVNPLWVDGTQVEALDVLIVTENR